ncbi:hypothetical protein [Paenibacillus antarcticus]|uniref:Uncharacterized protein n=1 Tax=Paenibacillus antarcticus TaxID=253703 RepID=A0A168ND67_9BACL|nr:hypothetical protein [Paenibacillus antarcticus]OAB45667.1 hypothetical protein PBAT_12190 [Paenibacillus antarcticus]
MYEGFIEMQHVVTRVQYLRNEGQGLEEYHRIEFGYERNHLHTPELIGAKEEPLYIYDTSRVRRWWY